MQFRKLVKWLGTSLIGNVVLTEILFSIPLIIAGIGLNYSEGTLSLGWAIQIIVWVAIIGIIAGICVWYLITLPQIRKKR